MSEETPSATRHHCSECPPPRRLHLCAPWWPQHPAFTHGRGLSCRPHMLQHRPWEHGLAKRAVAVFHPENLATLNFFCSHEPAVIEHKRGLHVMTRGHRKMCLQVTMLTCRGEKETRGTAYGDWTGRGVPRGVSTGRARGAEFPDCSLKLLSGEEARGPVMGWGRGGEGRRAGEHHHLDV